MDCDVLIVTIVGTSLIGSSLYANSVGVCVCIIEKHVPLLWMNPRPPPAPFRMLLMSCCILSSALINIITAVVVYNSYTGYYIVNLDTPQILLK